MWDAAHIDAKAAERSRSVFELGRTSASEPRLNIHGITGKVRI
jgi:hypothetical protein